VISALDKFGGLALQRDGRIVVAGARFEANSGIMDFTLVRYTRGGKLDMSFGRGGRVVTDLGGDDWAAGVVAQPDGKIVVAGGRRTANGPGWDFALVRYTSDGKLDMSFGRGGRVVTDLGVVPYSVVVQPDGKIVAAGNSSGAAFALVRYTSSGKLDTSFGVRGKVLTVFGPNGDDSGADALALQADGKIVAVGTWGGVDLAHNHFTGGYFALARYTIRGKLDASFGKGGKVLTFGPRHGGRAEADALAIQKDGNIVAAGDLAGDFALVRYTK
jgi:uncharacterized delta-60 repeat protein